MARTNKRDWLSSGIQIIAGQGSPALTIERLTLALGMTKGSFYHHFKGLAEYKTALLAFYEAEGTNQVIALVEQQRAPIEKLDRLFEVVTEAPSDVEIAIRAWALQDPEAHEIQARVDAQRMAYIHQLVCDLLGDPAHAELISQIAYAMYVGSAQIRPPLSATSRRAMFAELRRLYFVTTYEEPHAKATT